MKIFTAFALFVCPVFSVLGGPTPVPAPPDIPGLIARMRSPETAERTAAKFQLVELGEEGGKAAAAALPGASPETAYDLTMVIFHTGYRPAAELLAREWEKTSDPKIKMVMAMVLCRFDRGYERHQDYLVQGALSENQTEALAAMQMLGYIGDARVVEPLKEIFSDPKRPDQVRQAALWDLSHTPAEEAAVALVGILDDPAVDWFYKEIAIAGLRGLASQPGMAEIINRLLEKVQGLPARAGAGE